MNYKNMTAKITDNQKKIKQVISFVKNLNTTLVKQAGTIQRQDEQIQVSENLLNTTRTNTTVDHEFLFESLNKLFCV